MPEILGHQIGGIGYGMLSLSFRSVIPTEEEAFAAIKTAIESGCNLFNGGEFYGTPENNSLTMLRKYYEKYPQDAAKVVLNIKGATKPDHIPDGSPEYVKQSVENCLAMLGPKGKIDMFECARRDPNVPLEQTLGTLDEFVKEGKIGGIALSEVSEKTIREAAEITKIVAVEIELSLTTTDPLTNGIAKACGELGIPIIAYSPLGHALLTGSIASPKDLSATDLRNILPRFQGNNLVSNLKLVHSVMEIAKRKGCTPSQLSLAWLRALSKRPGMPEIFPIPGSASIERIKENAAADKLELTDEDMKEIEEALSKHEIKGDRYHGHGMKWINT